MNAPLPDSPVVSARHGPVLRLILNRPAARNALSEQLMAALQEALDSTAKDQALRVIVLAANGHAFSAGHDLKEMTAHRSCGDGGRDAFAKIFAQCSRLMQSVVRHPKPVIAEVQGIATAAGCQLVASCDLAIASEQASFATPGVRIGLFCTTPMVALTRAIGRKRAMQMLLTGQAIDAATAADWGLVNSVVHADQLEVATTALAARIVEASSLTVALGKQAFYTQIDLDQPKAYAYAKEVMTMNALAQDAQEGISAFLEKRVACWSGE